MGQYISSAVGFADKNKSFVGVALVVERWLEEPCDTGSNPVSDTIISGYVRVIRWMVATHHILV